MKGGKVGLEQGRRRGRYREKTDLSKSGRCYAEGRGVEEAILMQGRNQVLKVGKRRKWSRKEEGKKRWEVKTKERVRHRMCRIRGRKEKGWRDGKEKEVPRKGGGYVSERRVHKDVWMDRWMTYV